MCPHEVRLGMLCCRKCCQQENHEAQDKLDYTAKQLNLLSAEIKDKIKQMTEEVERKVGHMSHTQAWLVFVTGRPVPLH